MKKHLRWRYTCEFCGKTGGSGGHIAKHERGCTANPDRVCGMHTACGMRPPKLADLCKIIMDLAPGEMRTTGTRPHDLAGGIYWNDIPEAEYERHRQAWEEIQRLVEEAADGCPACILAAYRAMEVHPIHSDKATYNGPAFDFKGMKAAFWSGHNLPSYYDR